MLGAAATHNAYTSLPQGSLGTSTGCGDPAGQPPFSYVAMSSSHKTGTVQLMCLARVVRDAARVALTTNVRACMMHVLLALAWPSAPNMLPLLLLLDALCTHL